MLTTQTFLFSAERTILMLYALKSVCLCGLAPWLDVESTGLAQKKHIENTSTNIKANVICF